ncbi:MAG: hypothetical protein IPF92_08305 [Myxococcales bacterium]|nr:hypothetical protein [Myxococcales bacterium]
MSDGRLAGVLLGYGLALTVASAAVYGRARLRPTAPADATVVTSTWRRGELVGRASSRGDVAGAASALSVDTVREVVVAEGPVSTEPRLFALALLPGKDGVRARLDGREAIVTVDDLLRVSAYEHAYADPHTGIGFGTDPELTFALLAERLGVPVAEVRARAELTRLRFRRDVAPERASPRPATAAELTTGLARRAVLELALHLAKLVDTRGYYKYLVRAVTNEADGSYSWPRHAGATFFLAQAAGITREPAVVAAAQRAAALLRDGVFADCGANRCVALEPVAEVGSSALAILAFAALDESGFDTGYRASVASLARFLRDQQRPDGEFRHFYDRRARAPIDQQVLYYSGEATLALAKAYELNHDPADLAAATRGSARLGRSWEFFGSQYYFGEEHWTCQAAAELALISPEATRDVANPRSALSLCARWHRYTRAIQYGPGETPFDAEGGFGVGPLIPPRVTAAASRAEAAGALIAALRQTAPAHPDLPALEDELKRALAFILRRRLGREVEHLFVSPQDTVGRLPGDDVDWQLRIDYEQHAGSALVRWIALHE